VALVVSFLVTVVFTRADVASEEALRQ